MKLTCLLSTVVVSAILCLSSCQKQETDVVAQEQVSEEALSKIYQLGFGTDDVQKVEGGYLVEGDIFLSHADLFSTPDKKLLRAGTEEQYRTFNLVTRLPRVITVSLSGLPTAYTAALDEAIRRYNAEGLRISFSRVSSGANITLVKAPSGSSYLASAGFPTSSGNPYNQVSVNSDYLGSNPGTNYLATILAHEIGHCIGFRHTDYMNRAYSCGGRRSNEGQANNGVGAVNIPGTPTGPDPNSWMLACIATGVNRPFNANDRTALNYLY